MYSGKPASVAVLVLSLLGFAEPLLAQKGLTPQIGTWAINEEISGKPGRGFQIDVQNEILVLYFYGYEPTGESTYWLAAGTLPADVDELTADLGAYEGGMAFGDPIKDATYLGSRGKMTIRFTSKTSGEICLPDESCKAISAFNFGFEDSAAEILGDWFVFDNALQGPTLAAHEFVLDEAVTVESSGIDFARGRALVIVDGADSLASMYCKRIAGPQPQEFKCVVAGRGPLEGKDIYVNVERNAFEGEYYDSLSGEKRGNVYGFRAGTESGRRVLPN